MEANNTNDISSRAVDFDPFAGAEIATSFPTTEPQKEVWLSSQLGPDASCSYNESVTVELSGQLDVDALAGALNDVVRRHDALRATVSADGESLIISDEIELATAVEDWSLLDEEKQKSELEKVRRQEVSVPFDLQDGPLLRVRLIRLAPDRHDLVVSAHHIVCDGWSFEPLLGDLSRMYSARAAGERAELADADSFEVYVERHMDPDYQAEIAESFDYWMQRFRAIPEQTEFVADFPRPPERTFEADCLHWPLPAELLEKLTRLGARHKCSLMITLLCAFEAFVSRLTGKSDLVIGVPSAGQLAFDCPDLVGHCVNLLPMRTHVETGLSFADYLESRRVQALSDFDHQKFTYGSLVKSLQLGRDASRMPLSSVMFNIDQPLEGVEFAGLSCRVRSNPRRYEAFEQFFNLSLEGNEAVIECQFNTNLFGRPQMEYRLAAFQTLLENIAEDPERQISDIGLVSGEHMELLLANWGAGESQEVQSKSVVDAFESVGESSADSIACEFGGKSLSYSELARVTGAVAAALIADGVGKGDRVGIMLDRSDWLLIAILGVLRSGAAYVPLDPAFPPERLAFIGEDAELAAVITTGDGTAKTPGNCRSIDIASIDVSRMSTEFDAPEVVASDSAYLIYTSGSTGKPKGVEISHANLMNFLQSMAASPGLDQDSRLLAVTSPSFDISILELLGPITVGGTVVLADADSVVDASRLGKLLAEKDINVMQATPSTWRILKEAGWTGGAGLRALCGGEALDGDLADWLSSNCAEAWNMYGPTETTIWSATKSIVPKERPVSLGRAIHNTQLFVLDANGQLMPPCSPGELYIGGDGVAIGYWNREKLNASQFVENPHGPGRLYATGDEVRFSTNGELEFLGRLDNQVKLHGYRIELGDVENALQRHPEVERAVASIASFGDNDDRLVAYLKSAGHTEPEPKELRGFLTGILPSYMVPNAFIWIDEFPMTPNRKVDRRALPQPGQGELGTDGADNALQGETQESMARIWQDILGVESVGRRDDFFDLGGHSILVTRVIARIRQDMGHELPFRRFFEAPVLEEVADAVDALQILSDDRPRRGAETAVEEIEF